MTLGWFKAMRHWISVVARSAAPMDETIELLGKNFIATRSLVSWCCPSLTCRHVTCMASIGQADAGGASGPG